MCDAETHCSGRGTTSDKDYTNGCECNCDEGYSGRDCSIINCNTNLHMGGVCFWEKSDCLLREWTVTTPSMTWMFPTIYPILLCIYLLSAHIPTSCNFLKKNKGVFFS